VKTFCADGSVACCHARVGHCQAPHARKSPSTKVLGLFSLSGADIRRQRNYFIISA
jgi:hypothetical protein